MDQLTCIDPLGGCGAGIPQIVSTGAFGLSRDFREGGLMSVHPIQNRSFTIRHAAQHYGKSAFHLKQLISPTTPTHSFSRSAGRNLIGCAGIDEC